MKLKFIIRHWFLASLIFTPLDSLLAALPVVSFKTFPINCPGMAPEAKKAKNCRTSAERTFPVICEASGDYNEPYNQGLKNYLERHSLKEKVPWYKVYTLAVPGKVIYPGDGKKYDPRMKKLTGGKISDAHQVNLYVDTSTGRIVRFSEQYRKPSDERGSPIKVYDDPRLKSGGALEDGEYKQRMSPFLKGQTVEEQGEDFEKKVSRWIAAGKAQSCDFALAHEKALVYDSDPQQRDVDDFFQCQQTKSDDLFCEEGKETYGDIKKVISAVEKSKEELIKESTNDFNLDMIAKLREGLLSTQAGILASTAVDDYEVSTFDLGLSKDVAGKCNSPADGAREQRFSDTVVQYGKILKLSAVGDEIREARRAAALKYNRQTVMDIMETQWAECLNKHWAIAGGSEKAQRHYYNVVDRNRILGLIGSQGREAFYKKVKESFKKSKLDRGFDWKLLEERESCTKPEALWGLEQFMKRVAEAEPVDPNSQVGPSPIHKLINRDGGEISVAIRGMKLDALKELQKKIDSTTEDCARAAKGYEPRFIRKNDGLGLWKDDALVSAVVRDYASSGRKEKLKQFKSIYCHNKDEQAGHDKWKNRIVIGATAAAMFLPFAPALLPVTGGTVMLLSGGMAAASAIGGTALEVHDLFEKYDEVQLAKMTYEAELESAKKMDESRNQFYTALITAGASAALSAVDIYRFAKWGGQSLVAGRALSAEEQDFYEAVARAMKKGEVPRDDMRYIMSKCTDGDCTEAVSNVLGRRFEVKAQGADFASGIPRRVSVPKVDPGSSLPAGFLDDVRKNVRSIDAYIPQLGPVNEGNVSEIMSEVPEFLQKTVRRAIQNLSEPRNYAEWVLEMKMKMGENMLKRIAVLEAKGLKEQALKLRTMLEKGQIHEGIYIQTLQDEAFRQGWGRIKKIPNTGRGVLSNKDFFKTMENGELIFDMPLWRVNHSRDGHIWQLLYIFRKEASGEGKKFVAWMAQNEKAKVWSPLLDSFRENELTRPENAARLNSFIFGRGITYGAQ